MKRAYITVRATGRRIYLDDEGDDPRNVVDPLTEAFLPPR